MAVIEDTVILPDEALASRVREVVAALDLGDVNFRVEPADEYPDMRLALDLFAGDEDALSVAIKAVREALRTELGLSGLRTATEVDAGRFADAS